MGPELTSVKSANAIRELLGLKKGIMHLGFRHDHAEYSRAGHTLRVRHCASSAAIRRLTSLGSRSAPNSRFERLTSKSPRLCRGIFTRVRQEGAWSEKS